MLIGGQKKKIRQKLKIYFFGEKKFLRSQKKFLKVKIKKFWKNW